MKSGIIFLIAILLYSISGRAENLCHDLFLLDYPILKLIERLDGAPVIIERGHIVVGQDRSQFKLNVHGEYANELKLGRNEQDLFPDRAYNRNFKISPDGKRIAYILSTDTIVIVDADGTAGQKQIGSHDLHQADYLTSSRMGFAGHAETQAPLFINDFSWSSDGHFLTVGTNSKFYSYVYPDVHLDDLPRCPETKVINTSQLLYFQNIAAPNRSGKVIDFVISIWSDQHFEISKSKPDIFGLKMAKKLTEEIPLGSRLVENPSKAQLRALAKMLFAGHFATSLSVVGETDLVQGASETSSVIPLNYDSIARIANHESLPPSVSIDGQPIDKQIVHGRISFRSGAERAALKMKGHYQYEMGQFAENLKFKDATHDVVVSPDNTKIAYVVSANSIVVYDAVTEVAQKVSIGTADKRDMFHLGESETANHLVDIEWSQHGDFLIAKTSDNFLEYVQIKPQLDGNKFDISTRHIAIGKSVKLLASKLISATAMDHKTTDYILTLWSDDIFRIYSPAQTSGGIAQRFETPLHGAALETAHEELSNLLSELYETYFAFAARFLNPTQQNH